MAVQMYLIVLQGGYREDSSRDIQRLVCQEGGLILMVTRSGPIVALDDQRASKVSRHPLVKFMGGVTLNPHGLASDRLVRIFAQNLSQQVSIQTPGAGNARPTN